MYSSSKNQKCFRSQPWHERCPPYRGASWPHLSSTFFFLRFVQWLWHSGHGVPESARFDPCFVRALDVSPPRDEKKQSSHECQSTIRLVQTKSLARQLKKHVFAPKRSRPVNNSTCIMAADSADRHRRELPDLRRREPHAQCGDPGIGDR